MSVIYRPGYWTDVCVLPDGRFAQVVSDDPYVVVYVGDAVLWKQKAGRGLLELRCTFALGRIYAIGKEKDSDPALRDGGTVYLVTEGVATPWGLGFGAQSVAIDSTYAYVVRSNQSYDRIPLENGAVEHLPHGVPGSSQGISDVAEERVIWWADSHRTTRLAGVTLTYPNARGPVIIGQADPPQIAGVLLPSSPFTAIPGIAYEPHIAFSNGRYAIVARTPQGAAYVEVPPYPAFITSEQPPKPEQPKPQPKPEEPKPVSIPNQLSTVQRVRAKYATPLGPQHPAFLIDVAQQTGAKLLRKDGGTHVTLPNGSNVSQDILMFGNQGVDILSDGEGAATPTWGEKGVITGEYIDVTTLGTITPTPSTPAPSDDLAALRHDHTDLLALYGKLLARVEALERVADSTQGRISNAETTLHALRNRKYRVSGGTGRTFGHAHSINVTLEPEA